MVISYLFFLEGAGIVGNTQDQTMEITQDNRLGEIVTRNKRVRGKTQCVKLHNDFVDSKGVKHVIEFDDMGNFKGKYRTEISSVLGSLVRKEVGLTELKWKKVSKAVKDRMWEQITVCSTCLFIQCKYNLHCLFVY